MRRKRQNTEKWLMKENLDIIIYTLSYYSLEYVLVAGGVIEKSYHIRQICL